MRHPAASHRRSPGQGAVAAPGATVRDDIDSACRASPLDVGRASTGPRSGCSRSSRARKSRAGWDRPGRDADGVLATGGERCDTTARAAAARRRASPVATTAVAKVPLGRPSRRRRVEHDRELVLRLVAGQRRAQDQYHWFLLHRSDPLAFPRTPPIARQRRPPSGRRRRGAARRFTRPSASGSAQIFGTPLIARSTSPPRRFQPARVPRPPHRRRTTSTFAQPSNHTYHDGPVPCALQQAELSHGSEPPPERHLRTPRRGACRPFVNSTQRSTTCASSASQGRVACPHVTPTYREPRVRVPKTMMPATGPSRLSRRRITLD